MVKVGFICDGETEKIIFESPKFQELLTKYKLEFVGAIKYKGGKIKRDTDMLILRKYAKKVIIIKDLEQLPDKEALLKELKKKETITHENIVVVVKRMIEAWLLADNITIGEIVRKKQKIFTNPENETDPHGTLKRILGNRYRYLSKPAIAKLFIDKGFTIENAANHKQCHSAREFIKILADLKKEFDTKSNT